MKPATIGLFTFLASFIIYFVIGILLVQLINSNSIGFANLTSSYEIAIAIAIVASIVTGYVAWMFERS